MASQDNCGQSAPLDERDPILAGPDSDEDSDSTHVNEEDQEPVEQEPVEPVEHNLHEEQKDVIAELPVLDVPRRESFVRPKMTCGVADFISASVCGYASFNRAVSKERGILSEASAKAEATKDEDEKDRIISDAERKTEIKCLLSLSTPTDTDRALDWINIQISNDVRKPYLLDEFVRYCRQSGALVQDPTRTLARLNHMRPRAIYCANLPRTVRAITTDQLTDEFIHDKLTTLAAKWREGTPSASIPEFYMGIFMNIGAWDRAGFVHDISIDQSSAILRKHDVGTWLLRKSSKSTPNSFRTVFTLSSRQNFDTIFNARFLVIHGVGVYSLTCTYYEVPAVNLTDAVLNVDRFATLIDSLSYREPTFVSINEMLRHNADEGFIDISKFLTIYDV